MPPRRGRGRRGAAEPEDRVDRIERILEGLVQVEVLHAALIAEESLNEMSQFCENRKKRIGGNVNRGQSLKRQSSGSSSGNSSAQQRNVVSQGSSGSNELPTCPICQKKHRVSLPSGDTMLCDRVYSSCEIRVNNVPMYVDLIPLEMHGFDVILGMDWLSSYRAFIDCELKRVVFHSFAHSGLIFEGVGIVPPPYLIFFYESESLNSEGKASILM
ncbi:hypothetical protein Acr_00g0079820 [Actinidia rufa]|uniref:Uncharacterized protein n=1 Tax=Actinidia rufa TaxID=165716 RepID=A0A7J0DV79_9ERIC|nr:hypothetical protein Acr_00g0079820 [Actinidia rufa]